MREPPCTTDVGTTLHDVESHEQTIPQQQQQHEAQQQRGAQEDSHQQRGAQEDSQQQQQHKPPDGTHKSSAAAAPQPSGGRIVASPTAALLQSSNLGPTADEYQLLRMEAASQNETRRLLGLLDVAIYLSLIALLVYLVLKWQPLDSSGNTLFMCTTHFSVVNLAVACVLLPATAATACVTAYRCLRSLPIGAHKRWTQRRRRLFGLYAVQLASATLGLSCYLVSNAIVVSAVTCHAASTRRAIYWLAFVRWSCWNTTFLVMTLKAHSTTIVPLAAAQAAATQRWRKLLCLAWQPPLDVFGHQQLNDMHHQQQQAQQQHQQHGQQHPHNTQQRHSQPPQNDTTSSGSSGTTPASQQPANAAHQQSFGTKQGQQQKQQQPKQKKPQPPDMLVLDLPWVYHYPKVLVWLLFEGCHVALAIGESRASSEGVCRALTDTCDLTSCWPNNWLIALLSSEICLVLVYYAGWVWLIVRSSRLLHTRPWQAFKVANLILRLERRLGAWAYSLIVITSVVFWFGSLADCSRAAFQYHGMPTTEIMWAAISVIGMLFMQPTHVRAPNPRTVEQLQQFSFTEAALADCIRERNAAVKGKLAAKVSKQPMFCFESAIKLFYFSSFVYNDYNAARETPAGGAVGVPEAELEQLLKAMALYGLNVHTVIYDDDKELQVLFAWSNDTVVVTFRGSTTAANWIADAMMWRSAHPGSNFKNTQASWFNSPKIHTGFLRCWAGTGLDRRVLSMLVNLVETSLDPSKLKIYFTGHSLGGALATLAAYDLVQRCPKLDSLRQISVYTFGAPRAGNRAFARVYERAVPDTWHVINDQDTIPRGGKLLSAYKRNGQRVVVNKTGDIVVRPTPLEASMLQVAWGSNPLHHLLQSYQASLTAVALGQLDQLKALPGGPQGLLELIRDCPIVAESMYRYGNQKNLIQWIGGRVWYTINSRAPRELLNTAKLVSEHALMTNGEGSTMPAGGEAAAAAAARQAAARQRRLEMQQLRRQQQRERQQRRREQAQRRQQMRQLRRQGALSAATDLDALDLAELGVGGAAGDGGGDAASASSQRAASRSSNNPQTARQPSLQLLQAARTLTLQRVLSLGRPKQQQQQQQQGRSQQEMPNFGPLAAVGRAARWLTGGLVANTPAGVSQGYEALARQRQEQQQRLAAELLAAPSAALRTPAAGRGHGFGQQQQQQQQAVSGAASAAGAVTAAAGSQASAVGSGSGGGSHSTEAVVIDMLPPQQVLREGSEQSDVTAAAFPATPSVAFCAAAAVEAASQNAADAADTQHAGAAAGAAAHNTTNSTTTTSASPHHHHHMHMHDDSDPLQAAAAVKLQQIQQQAAADRVGGVSLPALLPLSGASAPLSQVIGYITGVLPAWPAQGGSAGGIAGAGLVVHAGGDAGGGRLLVQDGQHTQHSQSEHQQQQGVTQQLRRSHSSIDRLSGAADDDNMWEDAQDSGQFSSATSSSSSSSSGSSLYFDAADDVGGCGGSSNAAFGSRAQTVDGATNSAVGSSSNTGVALAPPSPFAAAAAANLELMPTAASLVSLLPGPSFPPNCQQLSTEVVGGDATATAGAAAGANISLPPLRTMLSCPHESIAAAEESQQQQANTSSLLAAGSLADALDRVQDADPVYTLGPGSATAMLNPARTAPQALFNPAAALVGVKNPAEDTKEGEGTLTGIISRVIGGGGGGSSSAANSGSNTPRASAPDAAGGGGGSASSSGGSGGGIRGMSKAAAAAAGAGGDVESTARGVLGMLGFKSPGHSAAGTLADTGGGSSSRHKASDKIKAMLPGSGSGSGDAASGVAGSSSSKGGGEGDKREAVSYLYSLDVRRLSLASPLLPGWSQLSGAPAAVLETQVHLPVVPEGDEAGWGLEVVGMGVGAAAAAGEQQGQDEAK